MLENVIEFPRTVEHMHRDMDKIVRESIDLLERSESLLLLAERNPTISQKYPQKPIIK